MLNVIYFPFAGGSSKSLNSMLDALPASWNFYALEYPGRGVRWREDPINDIDLLAKDLQKQILSVVDVNLPCLFWGYSFGSVMAFTVARNMRAQLDITGLCAMASKPVSQISSNTNRSDLTTDEQLIDYLTRLGGIPEPIQRSQEMLYWFLPVIRSDLTVYSQFRDQDEQIDIPILSVTGDSDPIIDRSTISQWCQSSRKPEQCRAHVIEGGHFCHHGNEQQIVFLIGDWLSTLLPADHLLHRA